MRTDLRISVKDVRRQKTLKLLLTRTPLGDRRFFARLDGRRWPANGRPVSLTCLLTALRKALVKTVG